MTEKQWREIREKVLNTNKEVLTNVVKSIDGWSIYTPQYFEEMGLDKEVVAAFDENHKSKGGYKSTIFVENKPVAGVSGVYGLNLLEFIASTFDVHSGKMGRGFRAGDLCDQLLAKWGMNKPTPSSEA